MKCPHTNQSKAFRKSDAGKVLISGANMILNGRDRMGMEGYFQVQGIGCPGAVYLEQLHTAISSILTQKVQDRTARSFLTVMVHVVPPAVIIHIYEICSPDIRACFSKSLSGARMAYDEHDEDLYLRGHVYSKAQDLVNQRSVLPQIIVFHPQEMHQKTLEESRI